LYVCALIVSQIAYTVLVETLNPAHSLVFCTVQGSIDCVMLWLCVCCRIRVDCWHI